MSKAIAQGSVIAGLFLILLWLSNQINWMELLKVDKVTQDTEEKLGDILWDVFRKTEREIKDKEPIDLVDSVLIRICSANNIDRSNLKLHLLHKDEINAFALPGGHLVIFSGLIMACENSDELAGVIAHEVAHITENHVAKKLAKEIGFGVVASIAGGTAGAEIIKEAARVLSSSAFDRAIEKDADIKAVDYLAEAKIATIPFADFLYKRSLDDGDLMNYISWISTHPNPEERAEYILEYGSTKSFDPTPSLSDSAWSQLKENIAD